MQLLNLNLFVLMLLASCTGTGFGLQEGDGDGEPTNNQAAVVEAEENNEAPAVEDEENAALAIHPELLQYIQESVIGGIDDLSEGRKAILNQIADFVRERKQNEQPVNLIFICTHNSRRSHMSQIWAATAAAYYAIEGIHTYSGGTEATAFHQNAIAAIARAGFKINNPTPQEANPHYQVSYAEEIPAMECFSKKYDDPYNVSENFLAIMNCSQADAECPFVPGAASRVALSYEDPKAADDTEQEATTYDERCREIAIELFYLMSQVNNE